VTSVEIADDQEAVQYRGQIMPLVRVSEVLQSRRRCEARPEAFVQVIVYAEKERNVGLVVDRILDIVEEEFVVERQTGRKGVLGSAVIQKRITDVLDVGALIAAAQSNAMAAGA
jgi:two-component system chemotaxis sensor kinase CheA